ncbi:MAG: polyprenyl synthetase family protein [Phycisphaerae bacterium]|nr:polyprenyl synthetase family protein [Phycisphaerae bacterium]
MDASSKSPVSHDLTASFSLIEKELSAVRSLIVKQLCGKQIHTEQVLRDFSGVGGKMLRAAVVLLCGKTCGQLTRNHINTAAIFELIHNATLLHDDVIDDGKVRRGRATVNAVWGNKSAILLGDLLLSRVFKICAGFDKEVIRIIAAATSDTCEGELRQAHQKNVTEAEYLEIITEKTAVMFSACAYLGAFLSKASKEKLTAMKNFGLNTGIAFQISDDLLDITASEKQTGKTVGRDIDNDKLTLPVVHFTQTAAAKEKAQLLKMLEGKSRFNRRTVFNLLSQNGSIEYSRKMARNYADKAVESLGIIRRSKSVNALVSIALFSGSRS